MTYNMSTLTIEQFEDLIRNGDDSHHNQIRVDNNGNIFLSSAIGAQNLQGIKFRLETFDAGNGYVGPAAANDTRYIRKLYDGIVNAWQQGRIGYIDDISLV